jgi:4-alpha-glucanotransferase
LLKERSACWSTSVADASAARRRAGVLVPLFSIASSKSWGIGEIADLPALAAWAESAKLSSIQLLPVNEMADGESSPYSAMSAMAIDPIFIAVRELPEFIAAGGEASLTRPQLEHLEEIRRSRTVSHRLVRDLKSGVLEAMFERFVADEWRTGTRRAGMLNEYIERERWWLDDYTLFRALHAENTGRYWLEWEPPLRDREASALAVARRRLQDRILYYAWLQWTAEQQWRAAHGATGMEILGDFPFMVSGDSADVWARQHEFRVDASVGVPPDAFSETGQDWGLPVYRWDAHQASGYEWLRQRARRCADLFDGFRVDHLVGFYRTFVREPDDTTYFLPPDEREQLAQGERVMKIFQSTGATIIAEDLGIVPDFVRGSLAQLGLPGLKVFRWERDWETDDHPFKDPAAYPAVSVAISGTHDTETMAEWWDNADPLERECVVLTPRLRQAGITADEPFSDRVRDALLASLFSAGSNLLLVPVQDVFGWRDRINTPAVVADDNWSWQLPWRVDALEQQPQATERAKFLATLARETGRS